MQVSAESWRVPVFGQVVQGRQRVLQIRPEGRSSSAGLRCDRDRHWCESIYKLFTLLFPQTRTNGFCWLSFLRPVRAFRVLLFFDFVCVWKLDVLGIDPYSPNLLYTLIAYANYDVCLCVLGGKLHGNICCTRTVDFHFVGTVSLWNIRWSSSVPDCIAASGHNCRL